MWDAEGAVNGVVHGVTLLAAAAAYFQTKAMHDNRCGVAAKGHTAVKLAVYRNIKNLWGVIE